jgi:hypothetical protein
MVAALHIDTHPTQWPKWRNFERDSYKMALKITPAEKFLLNVQPESRQAIGKKAVPIPLYVLEVSIIQKKDFFHS